jgi:hypothetical protein
MQASAGGNRRAAAARARSEVGKLKGPHRAKLNNGAEDWNRTSDTSIFSAVLYQLSYLGTAAR